MRRLFRCIGWALLALAWGGGALGEGESAPIKLALDAEFGVKESTSAQAIRAGMQIAIDEINRAGGVLGRPLALVERDNRSVPARSRANLRELAADPAVVAVFCGRYSPVVVETLPDIHQLGLPLLDPWAAADSIINTDYQPNYVFRLSLTDTRAMQAMLSEADRRGLAKVGLMLPNTEWGRSSERAAAEIDAANPRLEVVDRQWYNWGDTTLLKTYRALRAAGAQVVIMVANPQEGSILVKEVSTLPAEERLPLLGHWGVTGGRMFQLAGDALRQLDFTVVQTYSFIGAGDPLARRVAAAALPLLQAADVRTIPAPAGLAHAYDLAHILARAITLAGTTDRAAVRDALERVTDYTGLLGHFPRPFSPERHDALGPEHILFVRYASDGALEPVPVPSRTTPAPSSTTEMH